MSTITLPNIRVGSDLQVRVRLKDGGVAIDWSTLQNIKACIYSDAQRALAGRCAFSIDEEDSTLLVCTYAANKPQYLGVNRIVISAKYMGETKTYDKPAFSFVRWTADQEGEQITIDDPDVDVEISVEDVSSSILQEAVDAAFSAADRANEAAEAAEHMVDIHTGPEGKSAYEVAVEEGYTGTEEEWLASLKGDTGETPDISIGTVTTVAPGTPASASMTGTPEEPVLNLSIPQGVVGATPNFTVGTVTTGEPGSSVIVTITGTPEAPVLNLTIPQGMQGNTGSSVEFPYELVNNLTTNDATKGLSAAQGVVLAGQVSQLEAKVTDVATQEISKAIYEETAVQPIKYELGNITIGATWAYSDSNTRVRTPQGFILHLFPGDVIGLTNYTNTRFYVGIQYIDGGYTGSAWQTQDYTIKREGYVCILVCNTVDTVQTSAEALGSLIKVIRNTTISKRVSTLEENNYTNVVGLADVLKNRYIKYSDGSIQTTGSPIWVYNIPARGIKKVKVFVTAADTVPAAISFYSSDVISSGTYISGVQIIGDTSGGHWFEANVPNNAVLICVTNHQSYVTNPYFLVDYLSKEVLGTEEKSIPEQGIGIVYGYQKADNYDGTFNPSYTNTSYFPLESFQSRIRLTPLYGIRINIKQVGVLTIVKATGVLTEDCVMTTIKAFTTTKTGWQVLLFDAPVILSESESLGIGVKTDTARLVIDSVYGGANAVHTYYLHYTQNIWTVYTQNLLIDVLGIPRNDADKVIALQKKDVFAGNNPFRFNGPFYAHLFINKIYQDSTNIVIPSESLEDIRVARRLGFDVIEANVHKTSDNKFVVIHGASGTFGYEVTDLNGDFTYADTAINSVSLDWIKANIRYRSDIPRYRTTIPTLEEFLSECRLQGMIPFAQANTAEIVELLDGIMGYGNYLAYNGTRALTSAPIVEYKSLTTKAEILERARSFGVPYIYAMGNVDSFTDEELADIVASLHKEGYMIATAYRSGMAALKCRKFGFDLIASTWEVNDFDDANLCTLSSGFDWGDFQINYGTIENDGLHLVVGQNIRPATIPSSVFLGKAQIQVTFVGELYIECGNDYATVTSDGKNPVVFSSYFINAAPTFYISGQGDGAVISDLVFKASKC